MSRQIVMHLAVFTRLCALAVVFLASKDSNASFITVGCLNVNQFCTLNELQAPGAFIKIDDNVMFNNFRDLIGDSGDIKVTPIDSPGSGPGSIVGLSFAPVDPMLNPWFVAIPPASSHGSFAGVFSYDVNVLSGLALGRGELATTFIENVSGGFYDALVGIEDMSFPQFVSVTARCQDAGLPFGECDGATVIKSVSPEIPIEASVVTTGVFGSAERVTGGGVVNIGVSELDNTFTRVVPEPNSLMLFGTVLLGLGRALRRKVFS